MADTTNTVKQEVLDMVRGLPDDVSMDDLFYAVYLKAQLEQALADSRAGRTVSHEEVMREVAKWRQSAGR